MTEAVLGLWLEADEMTNGCRSPTPDGLSRIAVLAKPNAQQLARMYGVLDQRMLGRPRALPPGPLLIFSRLNELDKQMQFRGHAIKYVLRGEERYWVNGRPFTVAAGQCLIANPSGTGRALIDSKRPVIGLCADLPPSMIDGMVTAMARPDELERHTMLDYFNSTEFLENTHTASTTRTGRIICALAESLREDSFADGSVPQEVYLQLAEAYVADQSAVLPLLRKVKAARASTRKELLRGVERARQFIHDSFAERIDVTMMASAAAMSEFHFFRAFRQVHGRTPHKYLSDVRLHHAARLLESRNTGVLDVALCSGFADAPSLTKAFRKAYGLPPAAWREQSSRF
ncbi:MAG: helix-turn-helix transcriptional regulator [Flavobacteriales bacterium]|nr:helix-turn-helix transcriptional regulator [Flavobacteriales bacterium]